MIDYKWHFLVRMVLIIYATKAQVSDTTGDTQSDTAG